MKETFIATLTVGLIAAVGGSCFVAGKRATEMLFDKIEDILEEKAKKETSGRFKWENNICKDEK